MNTETVTFLQQLFTGARGYFELTYIDPQGHYGLSPAVFSEGYQMGADRIDWARVMRDNQRGYGIYYGLTTKQRPPSPGRRASEQDALIMPCLWAEIDLKAGDYATIEDIHAALNTLQNIPSTIIFSGGGLHALWKIDPIVVHKQNLTLIKQTLRGLALAVQGDTSVCEAARVFRLPGSANTKPDRGGAVCRVIEQTGLVYRFEDFELYRKIAAPPKRAAVKPADLPPGTIPHYLKWYMTTPHPDGQRNDRLYWTACRMYEDGFSLSDAESYLLPVAMGSELGERESLATIRSPYQK